MKFDEIAPNVWVFPSAGAGENCGVVLGGWGAMLVDPTTHPTDRDVTARFLEEMGGGQEARIVVYTQASQEPAPRWADLPTLMPGTPQNGVSLPDVTDGWTAMPLQGGNVGRQAIYGPKDRVLFCGEMLTDLAVGIPTLDGDSQGYLDNLVELEGLNAKLVVPRRGGVALGKKAIRGRIEADRNYIYSLHRHVLTSLASRISLQRALTVAGQIYEDYPFLQAHLANMLAVWEEMSDASG